MHKIFKILVALIRLVGIVSLFRIIAKGEDGVKALAATGDTSLLEPMAWMAYIILGLIVALVVFFVISNLFTGGGNLKSILIGVGGFLAVLIIGYMVSGGDTNEYFYNDVLATDKESQLVGGGLVAFYILSIGAIVSMLVAGVKKIMK